METKHVEKLFSSRETLLHYAEQGRKRLEKSGPAGFAYCRILKHSSTPLSKNFADPLFFERLYSTLALWGMHGTGPERPKMAPFPDFRASMEENSKYFFRLKGAALLQFLTPPAQLSEDVSALLSGLKLLKCGDSLTANTKAMHFILPELALPMDRSYTLWLFGEQYPATPQGEQDMFFKMAKWFACEAVRLNLYKDFKPSPMQPSVPKLIDNAIMGYKQVVLHGQLEEMKKHLE
ncbi:Uncharacterised protein [uncultured archaeon]|nr:Uncharacterised protein [uncultured archaeon]